MCKTRRNCVCLFVYYDSKNYAAANVYNNIAEWVVFITPSALLSLSLSLFWRFPHPYFCVCHAVAFSFSHVTPRKWQTAQVTLLKKREQLLMNYKRSKIKNCTRTLTTYYLLFTTYYLLLATLTYSAF